MRASVLLMVLGLLRCCLVPALDAQAPHQIGAVEKPLAQLTAGDKRAVVLFFIASDCPISNRYLPEMERLESEFGSRGVGFWFVYPNVTETNESIHAHQAAYGTHGLAVADPHQQLAALAKARITPEAAVFVAQARVPRLVYTGRIDDKYMSFGKERPQATHHDLEAALTALLAGHAVPPPGAPPVGCAIVDRR